MLPISLLLTLWLPALVGLGAPLLTLLRRATGGTVGGVARTTAVAGLLGIFIAATVASAVGLFLPVRPGLSIVLLILGWAGAIRHRRTWTRLPPRAWLTVAGLAAVVVVLDARGLPWYDTGLYHLQAVAWSADGPLPRGLANLHGPLGYACSWFAFAPVVEFPFAIGQSCFIANAILAVLVALPGVDAIARRGRPSAGKRRRIELRRREDATTGRSRNVNFMSLAGGRAACLSSFLRPIFASSRLSGSTSSVRSSAGASSDRRRRIRADRVVYAIALFPLVEYAGRHGMVSSLAPDPIVTALVAFAAAGWVRSPRNALLAVTLATFAVTVKLSAAPLAAAAGLAAVVGCRSIRRPRLACVIVGLWTVAGIVWLSRGIWLSGCPLFPSTLGRLASLPWAIAPADARFAERAIENWSKYHRTLVPAGTSWVAPWLRRVGLTEPIVVPVVILLIGAVRLALRRPTTPAGRRAVVAAVALAPAIAFWFAVAPDPRFGIGYLCTVASLLVAAGWDGVPWPVRWRPPIVIGVLAVAALVVIRPDHRLFRAAVVRWPTMPVASLVVRPAADGTPISMPVGDDRVWAAPRPATPDLNPSLRCVRDAAGRIREFDVSRARAAP
jgi:hypothetical protein